MERAVEECYSWLIWVTFDLDHEVWPVAHEPYFNLAEIRWSARFLLCLYDNKIAFEYIRIHCLQFCVNIPSNFESFSGIAVVWPGDKSMA